MSSGGGKNGGSDTKDFYGHAAWEMCCGQLDFTWGLMLDNELAWPLVELWDSTTYKSKKQVIYIDGNVYYSQAKTKVDPPTYPWTLYAIPWIAGTYTVGTKVLKSGRVWIATATTAVSPPTVAPNAKINVQSYPVTNGWRYVSTPLAWNAGDNFWPINSIVAWKGRLYTNSAGTKVEPPSAPWTLWKINRVDVANPLHITVEGSGDWYLYWGTAAQTLDAAGEAILNSLGHPAYRNKVVLVAKDILFGQMKVNPPEPTLLGGRLPIQTLITGAATNFDSDWQVNPWCFLAEALTHPVLGLGLPNSLFSQATWQAEADRCAANPALYYISPLYTSLKKVREIVADILGYPDAFVFWSNLGTIMAGHWPHGDVSPVFNSANTVDRDSLVTEPNWSTDGWAATSNSVEVTIRDWQLGFKNKPIPANSLFNMSIVKNVQSKKIDRPHIVREDQGLAWANEYMKIESEQKLSGADTIRSEKSTGVVPGAVFLLTDDVLGVSKVQRCTAIRISAPPAGTREVTHETERGVSPYPYTPTRENPTAPNGPPPSAILNYAVIQLPYQLATQPNEISLLCSRSNPVTSFLEVWFKKEDASSFQKLGGQSVFAVPGVFGASIDLENTSPGGNSAFSQDIGAVTAGATYNLNEFGFWKNLVIFSATVGMGSPTTAVEGVDYLIKGDTAATACIQILSTGAITTGKYVRVKVWVNLIVSYDLLTPQPDLDQINEALTDDEIVNGELLAIVFQAANPAKFEIFRVRSIVAADTGKYLVKVHRNGFNTLTGGDGSYVFGADTNDPVFIIKKAGLVPYAHYSFPTLQEDALSIDLRIVPSSAWVNGDITDIYDVASNPEGLTTAFSYTFNNIYAPTLTWADLLVNAAAINYSSAYTSTDVFNFGFDLVDKNGDLVHGALIAVKGQQEVTLWASNFPPSPFQHKNVEFKLSKGNWNFAMNLLDASGNQSKIDLMDGANLATVYIDAGISGSPILYSVNTFGSVVIGIKWGRHIAGIDFYWQLKARNVAYVPGAFHTGAVTADPAVGGLYLYSSTGADPIPFFSPGTKTIYAYIHETGKVDSAIIKWNV